MTRELLESMDIETVEGSKGGTHEHNENGFSLYPVAVNDSGEGLPYAPEDWPNPGNKWGWKAGKRIANNGYYRDRYMYLPSTLRQTGKMWTFASRPSVEHYIRLKFPDRDIDAFFASFSWKIPSMLLKKDYKEVTIPLVDISEHPRSNAQNGGVQCNAGNRACNSLTAGMTSASEVMPCDSCCSEPSFCRDCCCILCCRTICQSFDAYGVYIRCMAVIDSRICGHNCHIKCALRAYMAGTIGGSIGLDAEYYCRRCDSRTDLVSDVTKLLKSCESMDSCDDVWNALKVGVCVLRGSKKTSANQLLHQIELIMLKLKNGTPLEDIWKNGVTSAIAAGLIPNGAVGSGDGEPGSSLALSSTSDHQVESLKLERKIDNILQELRQSQEIECKLAEEKLLANKSHIVNLYQLLDKERSELSRHTSTKDKKSLLDVVLSRLDQIKQEVSRFEDMEEVAKGFGRVPKHILKEQFGLDNDC